MKTNVLITIININEIDIFKRQGLSYQIKPPPAHKSDSALFEDMKQKTQESLETKHGQKYQDHTHPKKVGLDILLLNSIQCKSINTDKSHYKMTVKKHTEKCQQRKFK